MITIYDKLVDFRHAVHTTLGRMTDHELRIMVDHISRESEGTRSTLSDKERQLKDILLRQGYKPRTVMSWFNALRYPSYLQQAMKDGRMSLRQATQAYKTYRIRGDKAIEQSILRDIRRYIAQRLPEEDAP